MRRLAWFFFALGAGCSLFPDTAPLVQGHGGSGGTGQVGGAAGVSGVGGESGDSGLAGCGGTTTKLLDADLDAYIVSGGSQQNTSHGTGVFLEITATSSASGERALVHFNLAGIPAGAKVETATLELVVTQDGTADQDIGAHHVLQDWNESATWNQYDKDAGKSWATAGGDVGPTVDHVVVKASSPADTKLNLEVTPDVSGVLSGALGNTGWLLKPENAASISGQKLQLASREAVDPGTRPMLRVVYATCK